MNIFSFSRFNRPTYRMHDDIPYPPAESRRDYFSDDLVGAIDISVNETPIRSLEHSALHAATGLCRLLLRQFKVKKAGLRGITFFGEQNNDASHLSLVGEPIDKLRVEYLDEVLIIALADLYVGLPAVILADNQRSDSVLNHHSNDTSGNGMKMLSDLSVAVVGQPLDAWRGLTLTAKLGLQIGLTFVEVLSDALKGRVLVDCGS